MREILVTGGCGYIGSHTCANLADSETRVIIIDNLINSDIRVLDRIQSISRCEIVFYKCDIRDKNELRKVFSKHSIDAVIHFAALKSVADSINIALEYYDNNVNGTIVLLNVMEEYNCKKIIFSSSATVYGKPKNLPIKEDFPISATNPYGYSKIFIEQILEDLYKSDQLWRIAILRYFNPIGAHKSGLIGENPSGIPSNIVPFITQVLVGRLPKLKIFGSDYDTKDGTGVRDYIHVMDLADGHIKALEYLNNNSELLTLNLGTGEGYSVLDLVNMFENISGQKIPYIFCDRRKGDIDKSFTDPQKAQNKILWKCRFGLEDMCRDSLNWQNKNPNGFS